MTLRIRPIITVSVTKKPDGRLVLNYTRTVVPDSSQKREEENSAVDHKTQVHPTAVTTARK